MVPPFGPGRVSSSVPRMYANLPSGENTGSLRDPVDLESRSIKASGNVGTDRRFTFEHRLPRKDKNGVLSPIGDYLLNILPSGSEIRPLRIPTQQFFPFRFRIEMSLRTTIQSQYEKKSKINSGIVAYDSQ